MILSAYYWCRIQVVRKITRLGHPNKMFCFPSANRPIFVEKKKKMSDSLFKEANTLILQAHDLVLITTIGMM